MFIDPAWLCTKSPAYIWIAPSELCAYKSLGILFKSLIANMAGFLLWLSITSIMIEVFKVALVQWLSMDMIYSTMEGIVPSRCRLTTRHLGATLFKLRLHQICKSHVAASMHHDTWGLMQSHFYWPYWRPDSSHHNEPVLGGYQLLLSMIQGTQVLIHYIEGSIAQLVKHKALNLVDVGSSPTKEATFKTLFSLKYISSPGSILSY